MAILSKKWAKRIGVGLVVLYIGQVILFETLLGVAQPENVGTMVLTSFEDNEVFDRVLSRQKEMAILMSRSIIGQEPGLDEYSVILTYK